MNDLDAEELFHLALKASADGDRDKTISYLKRSIALDPKANSVYLLAAEYAEIGMMQRAIELMLQALELNTQLWTAYFQLGLLYLTQNLIQEARNAFAPLLEPGPDESLFHFGNGMTQLIDDRVEDARESLQKGVSLNESNPALNRDVTSIIEHISQELADEAAADPDAIDTPANVVPAEINPTPAASEPSLEKDGTKKQHLFLSNYGRGSDGN